MRGRPQYEVIYSKSGNWERCRMQLIGARTQVKVCLALALPVAAGCGARSGLGIEEEVRAPDAAIVEMRTERALPSGCDGEALTIRLLSDVSVIYEFDPMTVTLERVGIFDCGEGLNSMSVDINGDAYVSSQSGGLFKVDLDAETCVETGFDRSTLWGRKFAMGFVASAEMQETLYIIEELESDMAGRLSVIELDGFSLTTVGTFNPALPSTEITGTGDGRIFGFVTPSSTSSGRLVQIDPLTVEVRNVAELPFLDEIFAFDFAFWGGAFYFFTAQFFNSSSTVVRFELPDGPAETLGVIEPRIIGAGSSVCAPL